MGSKGVPVSDRTPCPVLGCTNILIDYEKGLGICKPCSNTSKVPPPSDAVRIEALEKLTRDAIDLLEDGAGKYNGEPLDDWRRRAMECL